MPSAGLTWSWPLFHGGFHRLYLPFDKAIRLRIVTAGCHVIEAPRFGEFLKSEAAIMSAIVTHESRWTTLLSEDPFHPLYDCVARHLSVDLIHERELRVKVKWQIIRYESRLTTNKSVPTICHGRVGTSCCLSGSCGWDLCIC